ncbi:hypothetical protein Hs30E_19990 [Lactococcus hodotermopsidis]|uniref:Uncharacterized protein n=1 Tax=Pseudolactococcus hodotermopsidis TaxID=2709157 RepID=A0A6A0BGF9_9LACT|nr:hypothetical protein [Lactococcus hodotermopsidis]GFH43448.1 hypothetical protein Hs30E_19990 [Lactococcus hodotermopsidis]
MLNTIIMVDKKNYITLLKNDNGQYIVEWSDGAAHVYSELVATLDANEVISGKKELVSLAFKAKNGAWPPKVTQKEANRIFLRNNIALLQNDADNQRLFTRMELDKILPKGSEILASSDDIVGNTHGTH